MNYPNGSNNSQRSSSSRKHTSNSNSSNASDRSRTDLRHSYWNTVLNPNSRSNQLPISTTTPNNNNHGNTTTNHPSSSISTRNNSNRPPNRQNASSSASTSNPTSNTTNQNRQSTSDNRVRKHTCNLCGSQYIYKGDMVRHHRTVHEGIRPYRCHLCPKAFGRLHVLNKHIDRHRRH